MNPVDSVFITYGLSVPSLCSLSWYPILTVLTLGETLGPPALISMNSSCCFPSPERFVLQSCLHIRSEKLH